MRLPGNNKGMSLIEIMITLLILSGTVMMFAATYTAARRASQQSDNTKVATFIAQKKIEQLRDSASHIVGGYYNIGSESYSVSDLPNGHVTVTVANYPTEQSIECKKVTVTVTWSGASIPTGSVSFQTYISSYG